MAWWDPRNWFAKRPAAPERPPLPEARELMSGLPGTEKGLALYNAIKSAEQAYDDMYEGRGSPSGYYSEMKESMYDAIRLARELGLTQKAEQLERLLAHRKAVFRGQMS